MRLYESNKAQYDTKLAEYLQSILANKHLVAQNLAKFCSDQKGALLVIVFDNCDKRLRNEQLLMFEADQWVQREFRALVILPLREETYDNHHNEPPLDTALKDLVFRIEPPNFQKILQRRVQLAMQAIKHTNGKILRYELPNGFHVNYPASEQGHYLSSILRSVFEHDLHIRRLIVGLAGRNMRRAMEIFLEFCKSGHIGEDQTTKIIQSGGSYVLPLGLVTNVLLRTNLRFYDSERAYLKNLFSSTPKDERTSYFSRILILRLLEEKADVLDEKRLKGFISVQTLRRELSRFGIDQLILKRELEILARAFCILSEDFRVENLEDEDLVCLAPAGRVHLEISSDVYYFAAISEDTWFDSEKSAVAIADRIRDSNSHGQNRTVLLNARACLNEIEKAKTRGE